MPTSDDLDRDKFYSANEDDDVEYELEPPDPVVLAKEQRLAADVVAATRRSIDIDEIYREAERSASGEILHDWVRKARFQFRFRMKHLLVATAVLAVLLTIAQFTGMGTLVVLLVMGGVIGLYLYLQWQDKKHEEAAAARREAIYAERRAAQHGGGRSPTTVATQRSTPPLPATQTDDDWQAAIEPTKFRFQFSLVQLMAAMTTAAVMFALVAWFGNPATPLGLIALVGLILYAVGYEPPAMVALVWWLLLVLYVVLSIGTVIWNAAA